MAKKQSNKILRTKKEIMDFIDSNLSERVFDRLVQEGLPVVMIGGNLYAHAENIEEYFKARTRRGIRKLPEGAV